MNCYNLFQEFRGIDDLNVLVSVVYAEYETLLETKNNQTDYIKKFHIPVLVHYSTLPFALTSISEIKQNYNVSTISWQKGFCCIPIRV